MPLTVFMGGLGSGKTLAQTMVGLIEASKKDYSLKSNYHVYGSELITSFDQIENAKESVLLLDEMHILANSRSFKSNANKKMTDFTLITRKNSLDIYMTSQHINQVDIVVRNITDYVVVCQCNNKDKKGRLTPSSTLNLTLFDFQYAQQLSNVVIPFKALKFFLNSYDTEQIPINFLA